MSDDENEDTSKRVEELKEEANTLGFRLMKKPDPKSKEPRVKREKIGVFYSKRGGFSVKKDYTKNDKNFLTDKVRHLKVLASLELLDEAVLGKPKGDSESDTD